MEDVLRPVIVVGGAVAITLLVGWAVDRGLRRADVRHPETPLWGLLRRALPPMQVALCAALLRGSYPHARVAEGYAQDLARLLSLSLIGATAWLVVRIVSAVVESSYSRYAASTRDPARVRRVRTQVTLIQRVVTWVVAVVAIAAMLLTFPAMRTFGTSMLASAGLIGIVAGIAAQSALGNLFAGLQIAFGDMVRIGDTVVVNDQWGIVEEITLTFITVKTWDERRWTMPVSYFTNQPFENWSRGGAEKTGTVYFQLDHSAPIEKMREKLGEIVRSLDTWDGRDWNLLVTDTTPSTIEVRALVTAADSGTVWTARCQVREQMILWLREEHPYALPHIATAPAALPQPSDASLPDQRRRREQEPEHALAHPGGLTKQGAEHGHGSG
ncbi:mechanosensitive ion channel family protein [Streptomyces sp. TP-A0874]|uniref:mechanosensitive ion channel family protein n=1 Tax=Streptomyces sp. TP-A0874 TaxID=549819 RepID=UPI0009A006B7|nr:mechanosensitive ion channel domain-containing protein [Streptomyces sp. TP-A0874]